MLAYNIIYTVAPKLPVPSGAPSSKFVEIKVTTLLNPQVESPLFAAVLLLLQSIHSRGGRPGLPAFGFKSGNNILVWNMNLLAYIYVMTILHGLATA